MKSIILPNPIPRRIIRDDCVDDIFVFTQFYLPDDKIRREEIRETLRINLKNEHIKSIFLLNERIFTVDELGLANTPNLYKKVVQENIGKRLSFGDVFEFIQNRHLNPIQGYIVITNSDIFFDESLLNLRKTKIDEELILIAQLRFEFRKLPTHPSLSTRPRFSTEIFGPRFDSQDTWIIHSNSMVPLSPPINAVFFDVLLGQQGCDNKLIYLFKIFGFEIFNEPNFVRTYHNHSSQIRNYNLSVIPPPYGFICPYGFDLTQSGPHQKIMQIIRQQKQELTFNDNDVLCSYLKKKIAEDTKFLVPRVAGIENNMAILFEMSTRGNKPEILARMQALLPALKNNAGVHLTSEASCAEYSKLYLKAFENSDCWATWEIEGNFYPHIRFSQDRLFELGKDWEMTRPHELKKISALSLDVFHYIHFKTPWTHALRGKRILVVSSFADLVKSQWEIRDKLWGNTGVNLFPDCTLEVIRPPMTQGAEDSNEFTEELSIFYSRLDEIRDKYDIALVSCGGVGNIVCNYIFEKHSKSSIYIGGVLQMFFGILGSRWIKERPEIVQMYKNEFWVRPGSDHKPRGFENIESGCYW